MPTFYALLDEIKETMFSDEKFSARFLNEELRDSTLYIEGSEMRKLA